VWRFRWCLKAVGPCIARTPTHTDTLTHTHTRTRTSSQGLGTDAVDSVVVDVSPLRPTELEGLQGPLQALQVRVCVRVCGWGEMGGEEES
jgi:hypothetical protein